MNTQPLPQIYHWMPEATQKFMLNMHEQLTKTLSIANWLNGNDFTIGYLKDIGESSFVAIISTPEPKFVFKTALYDKFIRDEYTFLIEWAKQGVRVPRIIDSGEINGHFYFIQEFVDAELICDAYKSEELIDNKILFQMGEILRKMHQVKSIGYGGLKDSSLIGEDNSFSEFIEKTFINSHRYKYLIDEGVVDETIQKIFEKSVKLITDTCDEQTTTNHDDYSIYNAFDTNPITIFDSNPTLNHPYYDLAGCSVIMFNISDDPKPYVAELINGYFGNKLKDFNIELFNAFFVVKAIRKIYVWDKKKRYRKAKLLRDILHESNFLF